MIKSSNLDLSKLNGLILDMDGVLWRGTDPLGNLVEIFNTIIRLGLRFIMATNNATKSPQQFVEKLEGFGVSVEPWQIITSGLATAISLKEKYPEGGDVFVVGEKIFRKDKSVGLHFLVEATDGKIWFHADPTLLETKFFTGPDCGA